VYLQPAVSTVRDYCFHNKKLMIFQVLTVASMKMAVFWVVASCSLVTDVSEVLVASIIRTIADATTQKTAIFNKKKMLKMLSLCF
jgi:hypothetical protein